MSNTLLLELWFEILLRLQVTTLLTLKCVSKSFLSIIQNPNFISQHKSYHHNHSNCTNNPIILQLEYPNDFDLNNQWQFTTRDVNNLIKINQFSALIDSNTAFEVEGYVNGLLLIRKYEFNDIILWNPAIRTHMMIPFRRKNGLKMIDLGFGYDHVSGGYKLVGISQFDDGSCRVVEVYEFRTGNWRWVCGDCLSNGWYLFHKVWFDGVVYWLAEFDDPGGYDVSHIVLFDLGDEVISFIELPVDGDERGFRRRCRFPVVFNGLFAVFSISSSKSCLWVRDGSSWVELYAGESSLDVYEFINREFQVISNVVHSKDHELLFNPGSGLVSYDLERRELRIYDQDDGDCATFVGIYEENLAWSGLFSQ